MAHLRSTVWGPAEFVGLPPRWLAVEGLLAGCAGAGAIVGTSVAGAWYGVPGLVDGEGGMVCAAALALYLWVVRAGRALIGIVAVLGICLALQAPPAATGLVLAERGRVESVVVTWVEGGAGTVPGRNRYFCSAADRDGAPLKVRIWRGCGQTTRPGDTLAVVYDSKGRVLPRGVEAGASGPGPLHGLGGWVAALVVGCMVAVVRSHRLGASGQDGVGGP
ncbi:hypothetical protein O1Q96_17565 [Streptomyces sp. Qhu-G9]|uniref:hypothetical protein n=1 Tax=Streptomyces sp. Qhu-G9 TaxID=3452799 RepID=UPI0022AC8FE3|nr:hypothetical protein [Streptomyces aurantiacus]WAU81431.1 hypothetical protein O1Q96_17565 [Streptomyces aurantiacus]